MKFSPIVLEYIAEYEREHKKKPSAAALRIIERTARLGGKLEQIGRRHALDGCTVFNSEDFAQMVRPIAEAGGANNKACAEILAGILQDCYMKGRNGT